MKRNFSLLFLLIGIIVGQARPLQAADAVVGTGTAVSCTETAFNTALSTVQSSGSGTITFNCGGATTIIFTASKIISNATVTINGGGVIALSGANMVRPFYVDSNATLTLQNITLTNGLDNTYGGGAILSLGELTLTNTTIRNSNVDPNHSGGAIMSLGPVTMSNSLIENNSGGSVGGLFLFGEAADATITNSTFRNNYTTNEAYGLGGAITTWDGADLIVRGSTFTENEARYGGAIYNESANTTILLEADTVLSHNRVTVSGGGIYNAYGSLTLTDTIVNNNVSLGLDFMGGVAGGIFNSGSTTLTNAVLRDNYTFEIGGGIYNAEEGNLNLSNVTISGNRATNIGGGIYNAEQGNLSLSNVAISGNSVSVFGGGIANSGNATLLHTTFSGNSASYSGGGIDNRGNVTLIHTTFSGNSSNNYGGGINNSGNATLIHTTFSGNSASFFLGGGIRHNGGTITLKNVLLEHGKEGDNCSLSSDSYPITSAGFNLSSDDSCSFNQTGDRVGVDPRLGPLADNGGFTQTHMLLPDSPAIDAGQCVAGLATDQRGMPRLQGGTCDIGAVERQPGDGLSKVYLPFITR